MPKLRVHSFAISVDGYGAGPNQHLANPLGIGGVALHEWAFATRTFRLMFGQNGGTTALTMNSRRAVLTTLAHGSLVEICSGRSEVPGPTKTGRGGGATTRLTILPSSCSRITRAHRSP
jgi:hypothetical protein